MSIDLKPPAFQFYVDDFLGGTTHFTDAELGLYMRLLCRQWSSGSIPDDDEELASYSKGNTPIRRVKAKFDKGSDGNLRNLRMELERKKQDDYRKSRARNGRNGGRPRKPHGKHMVSIQESTAKAQKSSPSPVSNLRSPIPEKSSSASPPVSSEHTAFIDGWVQNFKAQFGFDYIFDGGRDGKAVREILRIGILRIDLLEIAKSAWKRAGKPPKAFNCEQASTIHGFKDYFNQIRTELQNGNGSTHQSRPNPRLEGVSRNNAVNDYAAAAKRKLERQVAEAGNGAPPQTEGA